MEPATSYYSRWIGRLTPTVPHQTAIDPGHGLKLGLGSPESSARHDGHFATLARPEGHLGANRGAGHGQGGGGGGPMIGMTQQVCHTGKALDGAEQ